MCNIYNMIWGDIVKSRTLKLLISVMLSASLIYLTGCSATLDMSDNTSTESGGKYSAEESHDIEDRKGNAVEKMEIYFVTGVSAPIALRESDDDKSSVLTQLEKGDCVYLVSADSGEYYYVYFEDEDAYGYVKKNYLTDQESAVCSGETYFTANKTSLYSSNDDSSTVLRTLEKNTQLQVIAKTSGDYWYVNVDKSKDFGYVKVLDLSSKKSETSSKSSSSGSSSNSKSDGYYIGQGVPPTSYSLYYAKVNSGYLAVRSAAAFDDSNVMGKLYTGDIVYAIAQSGTYWYCYAPSVGLYGYIDSRYLVTSRPSTSISWYTDSTKWVVRVNSGYLALRNEAAYNDSNIIGKLYSGDYVYVVSYTNYSDQYWYVYSPTLGKYGWVDSNYIFS